MRALFVPGHALTGKGEAHVLDDAGRPVSLGTQSGMGRVLCSCGEYSQELPGRDKRVKWMRETHKPQVLEWREAMT